MRRRRLSQSTTNTGRQSAIGTIIESRYSKEKSACCVIGLGVIGRRQLAFYRTCRISTTMSMMFLVTASRVSHYDLDFGVVCGLLLRAPSQWCGGCLMRRRGLWTRVMNKEAWGTLCCREGDGYE
ncbi:hypothetical protein KCV02_g23, partial [Aureobasidium melanogenum]